MLVPAWVEPLLSTTFFSICQTHISLPRNECNMFCIHCKSQAFCIYCKSIWHQHHPVIQIRRSSYHDVVRVSEIQKVVDISGVQTYVINSARVIFLNHRPQPKPNYNIVHSNAAKSNSHFCTICTRSLLDTFCFCSLGCKVVGIKKEEEMEKREGIIGRRLESKKEMEVVGDQGIHKHHGTPSPLQQVCSNSRRRKGIPHRAPLGP